MPGASGGRFHPLTDLVAAVNGLIGTAAANGERVDYLDGVRFGADERHLTVGTQTAASGRASDYTGQQIFKRLLVHSATMRR